MNFDIRYVSNLNNSMLFKINTNFYGNVTSITENNLIKWKKNALYLRVNAFSTNKNYCTNWGLYFLRLLLDTGLPFYVLIRATQRSSRLQGKGSTFISQLF